MGALRFTGTASVKATQSSGLRTDSVALVFQMRAIDRGRVKGSVGLVSEKELVEIKAGDCQAAGALAASATAVLAASNPLSSADRVSSVSTMSPGLSGTKLWPRKRFQITATLAAKRANGDLFFF